MICVNHEHVKITVEIIKFAFKALLLIGWGLAVFVGVVSFGKDCYKLWIIWICRCVAVITGVGFIYLWFFVC